MTGVFDDEDKVAAGGDKGSREEVFPPDPKTVDSFAVVEITSAEDEDDEDEEEEEEEEEELDEGAVLDSFSVLTSASIFTSAVLRDSGFLTLDHS